jgi:prepilin-type processing-associated H-X9-DG protein
MLINGPDEQAAPSCLIDVDRPSSVPAAGFEEEVSGTQRRRGQMKRMGTKILGGASIAGFAVAATLALAPAAHAETSPSWHSGGVNASMGDGSVRFISYSTNQTVWVAMGSRAGGEVVGNL